MEGKCIENKFDMEKCAVSRIERYDKGIKRANENIDTKLKYVTKIMEG